MKTPWPCFQLAQFLAYTAARLGIRVEHVDPDPAYTSPACPACSARNKADDRRYVCAACGWPGPRDAGGAINVARRVPDPDPGRRGVSRDSAGATVANGSDGGWAA